MTTQRQVEVAINEDGLDQRVADILHERHKARWRALTIWIIVFSAVCLSLSAANRHRIADNRHRVADIQQSRIESCKANYEGVRQVALVLIPKRGHRKPRQARAVKRMNAFIDAKKAHCKQQVKGK